MNLQIKTAVVGFLFIFTIFTASPSEAWRGHRHHVRPGYGHNSHSGHGHRTYGHKRHYNYVYGYKRHRYSRHHYPGKHGHKYSYRLGHRYYYKSYKRSPYYYHGYPESSYGTYSKGGPDYEEDYTQGWYLLKKDRPGEALEIFARLAQANPSKGAAKVGYSIASAELGKLDKGIWAMRRALRTDPDALHYLTIDKELRPKVEQAAERYEWSYQDSEDDPGGTFMLAALYYLLDDMDAAREAMERNTKFYDTSTSAENLKRLIEAAT